MKALFDTNILVDFLSGNKNADKELKKYEKMALSIISWMEILVGAKDKKEAQFLREILNHFHIYPLSEIVAEKAIEIRQHYKIKLPDAIIWATAQTENLLLVTRNTRDFPYDHPTIRVPYSVSR